MYDASSIKHLEGVEAIRGNVALYLGASNSKAVDHLVVEIVANCIDEASAGHGNTVSVTIDKNNWITVADMGRGIPVEVHPDKNISTLTLVATKLHAGGKSKTQENSGYQFGSVGTHGVGLTVVNALSTNLIIYTHRKKWFKQEFAKGIPTTKVMAVPADAVPKVYGHSGTKGTIIRFKPDLTCFDAGSRLSTVNLLNWLDTLSWFTSFNTFRGNKLVKRDPLRFAVSIDNKREIIQSEGFDNFFDVLLEDKKLQPVSFDTPFVFSNDRVDLLLGYTNSDDDLIRGYCNGVETSLGGTHVDAFKKTIAKVFGTFAKKKQQYKLNDLLAGAVGIVNIRIKSPKFDSQSKTRLVSSDAAPFVRDSLEAALTKWAKANQDGIREIIDRACNLTKLSSDIKANRKLAASLKTKVKGKVIYPDGLFVSTTKDPEQRELFLCEGDSAGGGAVKASDRKYQEVMCLRGKIANAMKSDDSAFTSKAVMSLLQAIGFNPAKPDAPLRVGKIIILTDADADGSHIASLLMALFQVIRPSLYDDSIVYYADTPLYVYNLDNGSKVYAKDYDTLVKKVASVLKKKKINTDNIIRAKGLGELSPDVLRDVAFDPDTRSLVRVTAETARNNLRKIMGEDISSRKALLGLA